MPILKNHGNHAHTPIIHLHQQLLKSNDKEGND
jgi:hypothetical protein